MKTILSLMTILLLAGINFASAHDMGKYPKSGRVKCTATGCVTGTYSKTQIRGKTCTPVLGKVSNRRSFYCV